MSELYWGLWCEGEEEGCRAAILSLKLSLRGLMTYSACIAFLKLELALVLEFELWTYA
jgi:hypothetical protein